MKDTHRRADHIGPQRVVYERNRKKIIQANDICALCGRPVDKTLKAPDPMSATVDHIIPLNRSGHPSDINNLQLAHWICNRLKSDKVGTVPQIEVKKAQSSNIYQSRDWKSF